MNLWYSWPLPALSHWEVELEARRDSEESRGAKLSGRSPRYVTMVDDFCIPYLTVCLMLYTVFGRI